VSLLCVSPLPIARADVWFLILMAVQNVLPTRDRMTFRGASSLVTAVLTFFDSTYVVAALFVVSFSEGQSRYGDSGIAKWLVLLARLGTQDEMTRH